MSTPLVAIKCTVYNHEPYLRDCLDGFVMQQTDFPFVAVVHDDASTDHSADIIREYAEKYPDIIRPIYETENQYSRGTLSQIMNDAVDATGAKYIALCEGDDYWTDPKKLQKQVDFLETHSEYDMVCGRYVKYWQSLGKYETDDHFSFLFPNNESVSDFTIDAFPWIPQILTVVYRRSLNDMLSHTFYKNLKFKYDVPFCYAVMRFSKICILNRNVGVYRKHDGGIYSGLTGCDSVKIAMDTYWDIYQYDKMEIIQQLLQISIKNYGYQYIKYSKELSIKEIFRTYEKYKELSPQSDLFSYRLRLLRALVIRIAKRPYRHLVPVSADNLNLQDAME